MWATETKAYADTHTLQEIIATRYKRFKEHCIIKTSSMYNRGDKGGNNNTNHSANMVSNQVAAQMAVLEEQNNDLEDNQFKLNDAFAQMARGGMSIGGEGGIPPVIDTKSMGTAPTEGNTDYSSLVAQQNTHNTQMQAMQAMVEKLSEKLLSGGGGDRSRNHNKNTSDLSNKRVGTF